MTGARLALMAACLSGCLGLPGRYAGDPDGAEARADGGDAATSSPDGPPPRADASSLVDAAPSPDADPYPWRGVYSFTLTRTGGTCPSVLLSTDTLTASEGQAIFHDSHCAISDVTVAATAADSTSLTLTSGSVLHDCALAHAEEFATGYPLSFALDQVSATVTADRYTQPGGTYECSIDYQITGAR